MGERCPKNAELFGQLATILGAGSWPPMGTTAWIPLARSGAARAGVVRSLPRRSTEGVGRARRGGEARKSRSSVLRPESLRLRCELVQHLSPLALVPLFVPDKILETDAALLSNRPARDLPVVQELHHERSRHVQEVRGLLRGQLSVGGHGGHGSSLRLPLLLHRAPPFTKLIRFTDVWDNG
jgi:hypothetical protein